jgi:carbohydrate diacid regulator
LRASRLPRGRATDAWGFADDRWLVLLAEADVSDIEADRHRIARQVQETVDDLMRLTGRTISAGVGRYYPSWPALARSFQDACLAAEVGPMLGEAGQVFVPGELGFPEVLVEHGATAKDELVSRLLTPLERDEELISTLEAFLRANLSPQVAARSLSIHRHTMAYRLNKIERLTALDPRQFQHAAQFHVALWWRKLADLTSRRGRRAFPGQAPGLGRGTVKRDDGDDRVRQP